MNRRRAAEAALVFNVILWGATFVLVKAALAIGAGGMGGGAHTNQEWFRPEGRDLGLKRIFLILLHLMRGVPADAAGSTGK